MERCRARPQDGHQLASDLHGLLNAAHIHARNRSATGTHPAQDGAARLANLALKLAKRSCASIGDCTRTA
jgi:hypothetical protein